MFTSKKCTHPALLHLVVAVGPFAKWGIDFMHCVGENHQQGLIDRDSHSVDALYRNIPEHQPRQNLPCPANSME